MSYNYFTLPGEILKEYMDARGITQKELANKIGSSERHISQVVNGKAKISEEFALKLETVFPDVEAEHWLKLEANYQLFLLRNQDKDIIKNKKIIEEYKLNSIFKGLDYDANKKVSELLNIVGESTIEDLEQKINHYSEALYMHDGGNEKMIYLWLKLCEEQIYIQNDLDNFSEFNHSKLEKNLEVIKKILNTTDYVLALKNIRRLFNKIGIGLVLHEALPTAKIRGATTFYQGYPMIYLSSRFKRLDSIYFALVHEIFHVKNKDYEKKDYSISYEDDKRELISNKSTRNFFIKKNKYEKFISEIEDGEKPSEEKLRIFAGENGVVIDIVIGFLQRDGILAYSDYTYLRTYVKEVES